MAVQCQAVDARHRLKLVSRPASAPGDLSPEAEVVVDSEDHRTGPERPVSGKDAAADDVFVWNEDDIAAVNYSSMGERLAASGDLHRNSAHAGGLLCHFPDGKCLPVTNGAELAPIIVDRVPVQVTKGGKKKGSLIAAAHLNAMLRSRHFLDKFLPVDHISDVPLYLPNLSLTEPGYNDGGSGQHILYAGGKPEVFDSLDTIGRFLDAMEFETNADRTNAVAAALTVAFRNFWPGGKPILLATANKSHAGKDTTIAFATGIAKSVSVSYQSTNWAFERALVGAMKTSPDAAVVVVENARLDGRERFIASAFLERFATDPEPVLFSTGTGDPVRIRNNVVLAISTNYGKVSEDILNRCLPIHLSPIGDVNERKPLIGNPKHEFLPAFRNQIAAELRGMVERWKKAGAPLDVATRHPFIEWARTIGGILKTSGFSDFLANYGTRKTLDDPVRRGLSVLGVGRPDEWIPASGWATLATHVGLVKTVIPESDRENETSRARGLGVVMSAHEDETFMAETDSHRVVLRLEKTRKRLSGSEPQVCYRFAVLEAKELPAK